MTNVSVAKLTDKLREWANMPHDTVCAGIICRHVRAREALEQVKNAILEIRLDRRIVDVLSQEGRKA